MKWAVIPDRGPDKGQVVASFKHEGAARRLAKDIYADQAFVVERPAFPLGESQEMVAEFMAAAGHQERLGRWPSVPDNLNLRRELIREEHHELQTAFDQRNPIKIIDGACDLQYTLDGLWVRLGLNKAPFFREVHRSNMTKDFEATDQQMLKVVKGKTFEPPEIQRVLFQEHGSEQGLRFLESGE